MNKVYIVAAKRTPIGSFNGVFSSVSATELGSSAIKSAIEQANIHPEFIEEVYMGNVLQAGVGQAPARQAAIGAGIKFDTPCTTINKVCASGLKSVMLASQSIKAGERSILVAGGMESMTNAPHLLKGREGKKLGDINLADSLVHDGLTDAFHHYHMGNAAELCSKECNITREEQDKFAVNSYQKAASAWEKGQFSNEIAPVVIPQRKGDDLVITKDEEYSKVNFNKLPQLKPVFQKEGTVTAANASTINDGAAALIIVGEEKLKEYNLTPLAEIITYTDVAQAPEWFTTAPAKAIPLLLEKAALKISDIDYFEINEAFSVVGLANMKELNLDSNKVNVYGGAVALGHPLGCSGARILVTLINVLKQEKGTYGIAAICNGGGGASAMLIKNVIG